MPQTPTARSRATVSPQAAATRPLFRSTPISTRTTASGIAATSADSATDWTGARGCGQSGRPRERLRAVVTVIE